MAGSTQTERTNQTIVVALVGGLLVAAVLIVSTFLAGQSASRSTEEAVHTVSTFYLQEMAERREQVVSKNLEINIANMNSAIELLDADDLASMEDFEAFEAKMKKLYDLEKFAFVDETGLVYTTQGTEDIIGEYQFDPTTISGPEISIKNLESPDKKVIIAAPTEAIPFEGHTFVACFMEIDIQRMLDGLQLQTSADTTMCNLYYENGISLTDIVLGGLSDNNNLLVSLENAEFSDDSSYEQVVEDFHDGRAGSAAFTFNGMLQTVYYTPVQGTNWMLTYLIRENIIADQLESITDDIIMRNVVQTVVTAVVLLAILLIIVSQTRRNARIAREKETSEAESRVRQQELEERLKLQNQLLEQQRQQHRQDEMITAMASDYRSVYYVDLDRDEGMCYRAGAIGYDMEEGTVFPYLETFTDYVNRFVAEEDRAEMLRYIDPATVRERLLNEPLISHRYLVRRDGVEEYEMLRMAGVRHLDERADHQVHAVGMGFSNVDVETREQMAQSRALSDALEQANEANRAKTAFLSNMSHEIRTPMNAIIGIDSIALADPSLSPKTREQLEKIGGSARHLLALINDILDMSRIESGRMTLKNEEFSFSSMLEQVNTMASGQCQDKGLHYTCRVVGTLERYYIGDDMKLRQVLINILGNAVKFTAEGGEVSLTVQRTAAFDGKSTLRFDIQDTGIGMDKDYLPKIFDAFSQEDSSRTNKYGSTGLGMAITKNIVEMMNGTITVDSEKGVGSTFTVTVTLLDSDRTSDDDIGELRPQEMSVLVIDDDPVACEHAKLVLEEVGIGSDTALSGEEALEQVKLMAARREPYDLILVDWKMPKGMDGVETTREIRRVVGGESAIIILTAYHWDDVVDEATEAGVDDFIAKPLFASNVLEEFRDAIRKKQVTHPDERPRAELAGRRVLLAEDMPINAEIMMEVLKMRDMEADHAENGRVAVELFEGHPAGYYDAILMDMRMPEMDGLEATATIRAMERPDAKEIPIIALTANAFDEDVQNSLQAGLNAHLSKPVEPDHLFETLETLIHA